MGSIDPSISNSGRIMKNMEQIADSIMDLLMLQGKVMRCNKLTCSIDDERN